MNNKAIYYHILEKICLLKTLKINQFNNNSFVINNHSSRIIKILRKIINIKEKITMTINK
jgi:hypothetical protein